LAILIALPGAIWGDQILRLMGGDEHLIANGSAFTRMIFASAPAIVLLYTLSGALRGVGEASTAMRSLWVANGVNIVLCPLFIFGWGPVPEMGVLGSAVATTIGRSSGVLYQLMAFRRKGNPVIVTRADLAPNLPIIRNLLSVAAGGTGQFLISSASWVFLTRVLSTFGSDVVAGYTIAIRIIVFTLLPSMGMANAAATLVGQNLGAGQPDRAETSAWRAAFCNFLFLLTVGIIFFVGASNIVSLFNREAAVVSIAVRCLRIICLGYIFFAFGMVISQSFNGAGDTKTPTIINVICFWLIEIPLAYVLATSLNWGPDGVFWAVAISESLLAIIAVLVFRRGRWKLVQV
jgi:putative MATE family efflux protein